jgi:hypothetical protein
MIYHVGNVLNDLELDEKAKVDGEEVWLGDLVAEYNSVIAEKGIYGLYHKQDNAFVYDCEGVNWNKISVPPEAKDYFESDTCTTRELAEWAFRNGYDAIRLDNIIDISQFALKEARKPSTVWAFKNPERQLRSADPITYDDDGNVIPLKERFNTNKGDFRYKLAVGVDTSNAVEKVNKIIEKENAALKEDVDHLKQLLKLQGQETHGARFTASSVEAAARYLKKNAGSKGDTKTLAGMLNSFY